MGEFGMHGWRVLKNIGTGSFEQTFFPFNYEPRHKKPCLPNANNKGAD